VKIASLTALLVGVSLGVAPIEAQDDLRALTDQFASGWSSGDAAALAPHLPDAGIDLSLDGDAHGGVSRRQARAAPDRFFESWDAAEVSVRQAEVLGGDPERALLEFGWQPAARGTPERRSFVIFVSLQRTGGAWRIDEIRVFS
jgi:hypothetical protein